MNDRPTDHESPQIVGHPVNELVTFRTDPDPELSGRVQRGINRGLLTADGVDFSLSVLVKTVWSYVSAMFEVFATPQDRNKDGGDG